MRPNVDVTKSVAEFHRAFGLMVRQEPTIGTEEERSLRLALIEEELGELELACAEGDLVEMADALGDLIYVVQGAALVFGIDLDFVMAEVHRSNMTKLWSGEETEVYVGDEVAEFRYVGDNRYVAYRQDGKVLKPPSFEEPQIMRALEGWMKL